MPVGCKHDCYEKTEQAERKAQNGEAVSVNSEGSRVFHSHRKEELRMH